MNVQPEYRKAKQAAFCRVCDQVIEKGSPMVSFYSFRNTGVWIHICPACVKSLNELLPNE